MCDTVCTITVQHGSTGRSQIVHRHSARLPNPGGGWSSHQLGVRVCQARPLQSFHTANRLSLESSVIGVVLENVVDDTSKFFGNNGTSNGFVGATEQALVESSDLRIVLDGPDGAVGEGEFEILIAIFVSRLLPERSVGVVCTGDEPTVADKVFVR